MNRQDEFNSILTSLDDTPIKLEGVVKKARRKHVVKTVCKRSSLSLVLTFCLFVFAVNYMPVVAYAAGQIPGLRELAKAVSFSPSLAAAVDNRYVQPIEQSQTVDGITATVEYIIVDQKQINIFYSLETEDDRPVSADSNVYTIGGEHLSASIMQRDTEEDLHLVIANLSGDAEMPSEIQLKLKFIDDSPYTINDEPVPPSDSSDSFLFDEPDYIDYDAEATFHLTFDPYFTEQGKHYEINAVAELEDQTVTFTKLEIYPTHMRLIMEEAESNTHMVQRIKFYLENEDGKRIDASANGLISSGSVDSPYITDYYVESDFFERSKTLTLHITDVILLDKEFETVEVNLETLEAEFLPEGVELTSAEKHSDGYLLEFRIKTDVNGIMPQVWLNDFYNADGERYDIMSWSSVMDDTDENYYYESIPLVGYYEDMVWLSPYYSEDITFTNPITVMLLEEIE